MLSDDDAPDASTDADVDALWRSLIGRAPAFAAELALLRSGGLALADVLRGKADLASLFFGEGSSIFAETFGNDAPSSLARNRALARAVSWALAKAGPDRKVRVLEIGGAAGGTAEHVLAALPDTDLEYVLTDASPALLALAGQSLHDSRVSIRTLDLNEDVEAQGFSVGSFDVVVAGGTAAAGRSLEQVRALIAPGGLLLMGASEPGEGSLALVRALHAYSDVNVVSPLVASNCP
jgi:hypothetical protein